MPESRRPYSAWNLRYHRNVNFANDPARTFREQEDIRFLLSLPGVDRREVQGYFERYGVQEARRRRKTFEGWEPFTL